MDMETKRIRSAKDLKVYQKAYELAMEIFNISKHWPAEEKYSVDLKEVLFLSVE